MSHKGFTLIECVLALMVMSLFLVGTTGMIAQSRDLRAKVYDKREQEWQICLFHMEEKLAEGTFESVDKNHLYFTKKSDSGDSYSCSIKWSSNVHRLAISEKGGFEPILSQVRDVKFTQEGQNVYLTVKFMDEEEKHAQWTIPKE